MRISTVICSVLSCTLSGLVLAGIITLSYAYTTTPESFAEGTTSIRINKVETPFGAGGNSVSP